LKLSTQVNRVRNLGLLYFVSTKRNAAVSKAKPALLSWSLLLCLAAGGAQIALGQAAAQPAPVSGPTAAASQVNVTETLVDSGIPDDKRINGMLRLYSPKVRALDTVIGSLKVDLRKGGVGGGTLGNFVTDIMRAEAARKLGKQVVLAVTNSGGLRKSVISKGDLRLRDIFELMPFENTLVAFDLSGAQVLDLLRVVVSHRDAQSGAVIKYRITSDKRPQLESTQLLISGSPKEIDPAAIYTVVSIDYLLNVTGSDYSLLRGARNIRPLGLTLRDAITEHVKAETAAGRPIVSTAYGRFIFDKAASTGVEEPQP
jgi:2',3'-cyclic-nucleotide 2'-phosphodiesterase (5'-nucleotidase family)